ncbi:MAG: hypothetical protein JW920_08190 [Deltaproteobacteria bacterium]|nr:hypothetical protein [Deltaproteobacteria bacterium]
MIKHMNAVSSIGLLAGFAFVLIISPMAFADDQSEYPATIAALKNHYSAEVTASRSMSACAQSAHSEGFYSIEKLFIALKASESVHAHNFRVLLSDFGVMVDDIPISPAVGFNTTKGNLKYLLDVELNEIDTRYPALLERVRPEGHEAAIADITYAWKAEMQHRDLIKKMRWAFLKQDLRCITDSSISNPV